MKELIVNETLKNLIPPLSADEYNDLKESVLREGIRDPIYVWKDVIIDGHNRYGLAKKYDLDFDIKELDFEDMEDAKMWMLSNQLARRNVTPFIRAELALKLKRFHQEALRDKKRATVMFPDKEHALPDISKDTREEIAKSAGVSHGYIHTVSRIKESGRVDTRTMNRLRTGEITAGKILKEIKREERKEMAVQEMERAAQHYVADDSLQIINADFYSWCNTNLEEGGVDLILTDPPYPKEYLHVWDQLGEVAAKTLKFGGYLAVYSGQLYFDYVMKILGKHLSYVWTIALKHTGPTQLVGARNLICGWKPILIFKNAPPGKIVSASGSALMDFIGEDYREKDFHEWGQGESAVGYLMKTLSYPNELVLDPFVGGGTTLTVAKQLKRKCIGIEIDESHISKIKANIMKDDQKSYLHLTNEK